MWNCAEGALESLSLLGQAWSAGGSADDGLSAFLEGPFARLRDSSERYQQHVEPTISYTPACSYFHWVIDSTRPRSGTSPCCLGSSFSQAHSSDQM